MGNSSTGCVLQYIAWSGLKCTVSYRYSEFQVKFSSQFKMILLQKQRRNTSVVYCGGKGSPTYDGNWAAVERGWIQTQVMTSNRAAVLTKRGQTTANRFVSGRCNKSAVKMGRMTKDQTSREPRFISPVKPVPAVLLNKVAANKSNYCL